MKVSSIHFSILSRTALGPTQPPTLRSSVALSLGVKRQRREADHSPPTSEEVKKSGKPLQIVLCNTYGRSFGRNCVRGWPVYGKSKLSFIMTECIWVFPVTLQETSLVEKQKLSVMDTLYISDTCTMMPI
jgi:hypothetical protein